MWKYVSRRIKDTFKRSANHFDFRGTTGVTNSSPSFPENNKSKHGAPPQCNWLCARKCWYSFNNNSNTYNRRWNFEEVNRTWLGAITWSSALVFGWYASQLLHLKHRYRLSQTKNKCCVNSLFANLQPYIPHVNKSALISNSQTNVERVFESLVPTVYLVSNDRNNKQPTLRTDTATTSSTTDSSTDELTRVLSSIENRLGLAAIEHGQYQDGLNLLRSAASHNHAPAMYNLGLCYETGQGVNVDEKMAMQLYRGAAARAHPLAMYNLGVYTAQGRGGLTPNPHAAARLLRLAAARGLTAAVTALRELGLDQQRDEVIEVDSEEVESCPSGGGDDVIPLHSTLFVHDEHALQAQNCQAAVH